MRILPKAAEFIKGVCHPRERTDLLLEAGLRWVRLDVPFPYEGGDWTRPCRAYLDFRARCARYAERGIRAMCVTPYPREFAARGVDPASAEGLERVRTLCRFLAADLAPLGVGWQITNEQNVFHFRVPLALDQVPAFLLAGLRGVREGAPEAVSGYNTAGIGHYGGEIGEAFADLTGDEAEVLVKAMNPYRDLMDYIGLDTYKGTWTDGEPEDIVADVDRAHRLTGLPVLLQEFGFASAGGSFDYERGMAYLHGLGYARLADVLADPHRFLQALPADVARVVNKSPEADRAQNALSLLPHILKQWPGGSRRYAHTPEGQAAFYDSLLEQLLAYPHICGAFIYCWSDSERCYLCRAEDCPCETAWGITYIDETPKPVYDVIRKHFAAV